MEQHAVPQDITGFKFKLVGDMTLKQFGELAFGAIMAYIFFASNWNPLLKWPLTVFFGLFGIALAFLPIEERPLDIWIINFFRAIYRPTYYIWKKDNLAFVNPAKNLDDATITPMTINTDNNQTQQPALWPYSPEGTSAKPGPKPASPASPAVVPIAIGTKEGPSVDELAKIRDQKAKEISTPTSPAMTIDDLAALRQQKTTAQTTQSNTNLATKEQQLNDLISKNKELMMQIDALKIQNDANNQTKIDSLTQEKNTVLQQMTSMRDAVTTERVAPITQPEYKQPVQAASQVRVAKPPPTPATVTLTENPNIINGIAEDSNGSPIEGVILTIKDKAGNAIRALRTNRVGQFIVGTPLENGTYYLELEKNNYSFDTLEVTLNGSVITPIEIKSKPSA